MNQASAPIAADNEAAPTPTFDAIPLGGEVRRAVDALGYVHPTPVQLAVFDPATRGKSLVVQARTGTGKTAAFGLPIIDTLVKRSQPGVQALILTPTRELALQVGRELEQLAQFRGTKIVPIYGGAPMGRQITALEEGAQVVVGTPGRVLDHLRRGTLDPSNIRIFVLDEADEMLSMGFQKELNAIIETLPKDRQGLYFSATIPPDVERLANNHLRDPEYVTLSSDQIGALSISHFVYLVREGDKRAALARIIEVEDPESAVVFCNTKDETERVAEALKSRGYDADWLNGDLEQRERERVMQATRDGKLRFLVATDVAARGIDISHLASSTPTSRSRRAAYVHRTGRTGRAGHTGTAISMVGGRRPPLHAPPDVQDPPDRADAPDAGRAAHAGRGGHDRLPRRRLRREGAGSAAPGDRAPPAHPRQRRGRDRGAPRRSPRRVVGEIRRRSGRRPPRETRRPVVRSARARPAWPIASPGPSATARSRRPTPADGAIADASAASDASAGPRPSRTGSRPARTTTTRRSSATTAPSPGSAPSRQAGEPQAAAPASVSTSAIAADGAGGAIAASAAATRRATAART
ncbi:MAG: DEAD/DEAH box helicase [Labilithrix sp.]|nr:DEAD/DEAH box helicase [Labilithrix sp.]